MSSEPPNAADDALPESLEQAGAYANAIDGFEHGLVVLAMGRPYWLVPAEHGYRLLVEPDAATEARRQLACFDRESMGWPPPPIEDPAARRPITITTPLVWSLVVLAVFWGELENPDWIDRGALDSVAVLQHHEWWRTFTALFLHADAGHVISNGLSGILVFSAVVSTLGRWRGWLLVMVAGALGNAAAVLIHAGAPYRAIGASTAVFAGVGLLAGRAVRVVARHGRPWQWRAIFVPLAVGATVLALYGAGGVRVDVVAHLTGFIAGVVMGVIAGLPRSEKHHA